MNPLAYIVRFASGLLALLVLTSGCATSLGYVPGYVKSQNDKQPPTYQDVREWAVKVRNGYDTRMTTNRYAGYFGVVIAAAAAGAMAGLAAFDKGSSAIIGIPIGATFLGSLFGLFQNEDKAKVYGHAARYINDLLRLSDQRMASRTAAEENPQAAVDIATTALNAADANLKAATKRLLALQIAFSADLKAVAEASDPTERKALQDKAAATQQLLAAADKGLSDAEARRNTAAKRLEAATARNAPGGLRTDQSTAAAEKAEALCLQQDINAVMAKVADLLYPFDPNAQKALGAVKAQDGSKSASTEPKPDNKPPVLTDFDLPAKSVCDNA